MLHRLPAKLEVGAGIGADRTDHAVVSGLIFEPPLLITEETMTRLEYRIELLPMQIGDHELDDTMSTCAKKLNRLGDEGWEIACTWGVRGESFAAGWAILKRSKLE